MVLVDTSVWIALYRKENEEIGQRIWVLAAANEAAVCGQVWVEFLGGFRKPEVRREYERLFRAYPFLETERRAFEKAATFLAEHPRLGPGDAIIAATAIETATPLWTLDRDFDVLQGSGLRNISVPGTRGTS